MSIIILGIESSCDDTAAAIIKDGYLLSSVISGQDVHREYGGVVPELASRAHQQNIIPVVDTIAQSFSASPAASITAFSRTSVLGSSVCFFLT